MNPERPIKGVLEKGKKRTVAKSEIGCVISLLPTKSSLTIYHTKKIPARDNGKQRERGHINDPSKSGQAKLGGTFLGICVNRRKIEPMNKTKDEMSSLKRKRGG